MLLKNLKIKFKYVISDILIFINEKIENEKTNTMNTEFSVILIPILFLLFITVNKAIANTTSELTGIVTSSIAAIIMFKIIPYWFNYFLYFLLGIVAIFGITRPDLLPEYAAWCVFYFGLNMFKFCSWKVIMVIAAFGYILSWVEIITKIKL